MTTPTTNSTAGASGSAGTSINPYPTGISAKMTTLNGHIKLYIFRTPPFTDICQVQDPVQNEYGTGLLVEGAFSLLASAFYL